MKSLTPVLNAMGADLDPSTTLAFLRFLDDEGFLEHLD